MTLPATIRGVIAKRLVWPVTVFDFVCNPKDNWALYSKATNLIVVAIIKSRGKYEKFASLLEPLLATDTAALSRLIDLKQLSTVVDQNVRRP